MSFMRLYSNVVDTQIRQMKDLQSALPHNFDYYICSYPRSGNTWVRSLVAGYLLAERGYDITDFFPVHQDAIIPDIHAHNISDVICDISIPFRAVKSHSYMTSLGTHSTIYLFRRPEDALISYYHFYLRYPNLREIVQGVMPDDFCVILLDSWIQSVVFSVNQMSKGGRIFFMSYEFLHKNTTIALAAILKFLGINPDEKLMKIAIAACEFQKCRKREISKNSDVHGGELFYRKGVIG